MKGKNPTFHLVTTMTTMVHLLHYHQRERIYSHKTTRKLMQEKMQHFNTIYTVVMMTVVLLTLSTRMILATCSMERRA